MTELKNKFGNKKQARGSPTHQLTDKSFEKFSSNNRNYHKLSTYTKQANTNIVAVEQNNDVILQQPRLKIQKEEYPETILMQNTRYQHYLCQLDRMSIQD